MLALEKDSDELQFHDDGRLELYGEYDRFSSIDLAPEQALQLVNALCQYVRRTMTDKEIQETIERLGLLG